MVGQPDSHAQPSTAPAMPSSPPPRFRPAPALGQSMGASIPAAHGGTFGYPPPPPPPSQIKPQPRPTARSPRPTASPPPEPRSLQPSPQPSPQKSPRPQPTPAPSATAASVKKQRRLPLGCFFLTTLIGSGMTSGTVAIALGVLATLPPETNCQISEFETDRAVLSCINEAIQSGDLDAMSDGLTLVSQWTPENPLYEEAQQALVQWSETILEVAYQLAYADNVEVAIDLVRRIPSVSPLYDQAQARLAELDYHHSTIRPMILGIHHAFEQQAWTQAEQQIRDLHDSPDYPGRSRHVSALTTQLKLEQDGVKRWQQIQELIKLGTPQYISRALDIARLLPPDTHIGQLAHTTLEPVAAQLLAHGKQQWEQGQLEAAIATARRVAVIPSLTAEAQNLERLSQAQQLVNQAANPWTPSAQDSFRMMEAIAAVQQIPSQSQFYAKGQQRLQHWEAQLADLNQLQWANAGASVGWSPTLAWAANQADAIDQGSPRRVQGQTLAAHWQNQVDALQTRHSAP